MKSSQPHRIKTISEYHRFRGMPSPAHPLISVINLANTTYRQPTEPMSLVQDYYAISIKRHFNARIKYGQQPYDFDEGSMAFTAPGQVLSFTMDDRPPSEPSGWLLLVHPDFLWNTPLAKTIKQYEYFDYAVNEALFLSEKEETIIRGILQNIEQEYHANIDQFSQNIIIAQLEVLLSYADRFYQRQFITRKIIHHQILDRLESVLTNYFNNESLAEKGIPTVQHLAEALNVSPNYLSSLLKVLTGQSTQQHIHDKLIEKAKERLSTTDLSVSEIAYELGFEYSQSFSRLFKTKTNLSPLEFRHSFN
jgi:AraC family transcriptional regulator, transcriptional activator of pobA